MTEHSVLIIDDDAGALEAFEPMLAARGYAVRVALDAESGLREIERALPSAVILDLHLPTIGGLALLRRLRSTAAHAGVPVALVTGDYLLDHGVSDELRALGAKLVFKPLWEEDLVRLVEGLIDSQSTGTGIRC